MARRAMCLLAVVFWWSGPAHAVWTLAPFNDAFYRDMNIACASGWLVIVAAAVGLCLRILRRGQGASTGGKVAKVSAVALVSVLAGVGWLYAALVLTFVMPGESVLVLPLIALALVAAVVMWVKKVS